MYAVNSENLLCHKNPTPDTFSLSGVYKLTCPDCNKAYVGQTGRRFATRFKEQEKALRKNSHPSSFAEHLNEEAHSFGPMNSIMQILHCHKNRCPPEHTCKISHPQRVCRKQPLKGKPNRISERNLWYPHKGPPPIKAPLSLPSNSRQTRTLQQGEPPPHTK